jgi:steroid delta-isomerase-like uncharacterized protein
MAEQSLIDIAKAPIIAYNAKDWEAVKAAVAPGFIYDEVGTQRKIKGIDDVLAAWRGWATAIPDSKATFDNASTSGNTVTLEVTWRGTQTGPLQAPTGQILQPSGRKIEMRACQVIEVANGKVQVMRHYYDMVTMLQQLGALSGV